MGHPWLEGVDGEHVPRLIESDAPVIRCVAGPGSGKTLGLKKRVERLVQAGGVPPEQIFVGTFTRAIAQDLTRALGEFVMPGITISTLHSLGLRLLRNNPHVTGDRHLRFLLGFERAAMLYDVGTALGQGTTYAKLEKKLKRLQSAKSERAQWDDAAFAGAVEGWLRTHGGMLVEEVVWLTVQALENGDIDQGQFDHVVVDEYQDLTASEQRLVELVWSREGSLVVLGDDDQSIYGFRYCHPQGVAGFAARFQAVDEIPLPENRRCGTTIVGLANLMMAEAGSQKPPMVATKEDAGEATLLYWPTVDDEVDGLASYITTRRDTSFLVLVPRRFIGYRLADRIGEDAATAFHDEVLDHALLQERFTLASLLADPTDHVALRAWIGLQSGTPEGAARRNAAAYAGIPLDQRGVELARGIAAGEVVVRGTGQANIRDRCRTLLESLAAMPAAIERQVDELFNPDLANGAHVKPQDRRRVARDLESLRMAGRAMIEERQNQNLGRVVNRLRYHIAVRLPLVERNVPARVRIMTLHSAKGLEGDVIIAAGISDQTIPGFNKGELREEQRRLLYVTATRARQQLVISWPRAATYEDAKANYIRIDPGTVFTAPGGERRVRLGRSTLLPGAAPAARPGRTWLREMLEH